MSVVPWGLILCGLWGQAWVTQNPEGLELAVGSVVDSGWGKQSIASGHTRKTSFQLPSLH